MFKAAGLFVFLFAVLPVGATQITLSGGTGRVVTVRIATDEYGKFYMTLKNDDTATPVEFYFDYSSMLTPRYLSLLLTALGDHTDVVVTADNGSIESLDANVFRPQTNF